MADNRRRARTPGRARLSLLLAGCLLLSGAAGDERREPTRGVQLFRNTRTHLEFTPEGAAILRNAPRPFCIVSVVGPTRTGKSALIGRCFAQPASFDVGGDLFSKTSGVWISDTPTMMEVGEGEGKRAVAVYVVDTEGFHGVLQRTTQSFEANMFAVVCLMSSVVIYNSRAPLDARDVERLRTFATATAIVRDELCARIRVRSVCARGMGEVEQLRKPSLVWAVQNMNFKLLDAALARLDAERSLAESAEEPVASGGEAAPTKKPRADSPSNADLAKLAKALLRAPPLTDAAAAEQAGSADGQEGEAEAGEAGEQPVDAIAQIFGHVQLHPLHAPHHDDEVLADLSLAEDSQLSPAYVRDTAQLRRKCARRLAAVSMGGTELSGEALYWHLERWQLEGRVDVPEPNVAAAIVEAKLRRACAVLVHGYADMAASPPAPVEGAEREVAPHLAKPFAPKAALAGAHLELDVATLALLAEPREALAGRLVLGRNDAMNQFDELCQRWLGVSASGSPAGRGAGPQWLPLAVSFTKISGHIDCFA
ncbi:guanylate-binding protein [Pavlovales sp. CCMP2436]|nr:guanylate-binding protein [Pavlovales sp. CCMP2436]